MTERDIEAIASWRSDAPDPGRANGIPEKRCCLDCPWHGKGIMAQADHWAATGHLIVYATDPRAKARMR